LVDDAYNGRKGWVKRRKEMFTGVGVELWMLKLKGR